MYWKLHILKFSYRAFTRVLIQVVKVSHGTLWFHSSDLSQEGVHLDKLLESLYYSQYS